MEISLETLIRSGTVAGPQGLQGIQGPQSVQGLQGIQGLQGGGEGTGEDEFARTVAFLGL